VTKFKAKEKYEKHQDCLYADILHAIHLRSKSLWYCFCEVLYILKINLQHRKPLPKYL
jgi:hypothetical protein